MRIFKGYIVFSIINGVELIPERVFEDLGEGTEFAKRHKMVVVTKKREFLDVGKGYVANTRLGCLPYTKSSTLELNKGDLCND